MSQGQVCSRCVYDESVPFIAFDEQGVCNYCGMHDALDRRYPAGAEGWKIIEGMADEIRQAGRGKQYDCVVGVSGGCDSSFLLYLMKEKLGLRPVAVHFDNTWNSAESSQNIYRVCEALGVDLHTLVVDNKEYNDIYRAFLLARLKDVDAPTDIAFISALYMACEKFGVRHIVEGSCFRTEGISPLGWLYMDGKFIESVHAQHATMPLRTYPNLTLPRFLKWSAWNGIKRIRPLWHYDYDKAATKAMLAERFGWAWYGGHHLENRFTAFAHRYVWGKRGAIDTRLLGHAALVRIGQMDRSQALRELAVEQTCPDDLIRLVCKRLGFTRQELEDLMNEPMSDWREFKTYKKKFEMLRPLFWILMKLDRVPESFYFKFCKPLGPPPTK